MHPLIRREPGSSRHQEHGILIQAPRGRRERDGKGNPFQRAAQVEEGDVFVRAFYALSQTKSSWSSALRQGGDVCQACSEIQDCSEPCLEGFAQRSSIEGLLDPLYPWVDPASMTLPLTDQARSSHRSGN